jgi:hypothetical protein
MDAEVSSLLPTTIRIDLRVLPLMIDSVVWAERRRPLREGDRSAQKYFEKTGQLIKTTILEREVSVPSLPGRKSVRQQCLLSLIRTKKRRDLGQHHRCSLGLARVRKHQP